MQTEKEDIVIVILTASLFILLFGFITFLVILNFIKRKRIILAEKKIREAEFEQELLQAQLEMQEHIFKTISQEIHDNAGQILSIMKVNLNIVTFEQPGNEKLENIKDLLTDAIRELRDLSAGYYADRLVEEGLLVAIQHQLQQLDRTGLFTTSFNNELQTISVDKSKVIFIHRMVQEILHNVVKHSGASEVKVHISGNDEIVHLSLQDNGKGFDTGSKEFKAGIGLSSIRQRASMIGADIDIDSKLGVGTTVKIAFKPNE